MLTVNALARYWTPLPDISLFFKFKCVMKTIVNKHRSQMAAAIVLQIIFFQIKRFHLQQEYRLWLNKELMYYMSINTRHMILHTDAGWLDHDVMTKPAVVPMCFEPASTPAPPLRVARYRGTSESSPCLNRGTNLHRFEQLQIHLKNA